MAKLENLKQFDLNVAEFWKRATLFRDHAGVERQKGTWTQAQINQIQEIFDLMQLTVWCVEEIAKNNR